MKKKLPKSHRNSFNYFIILILFFSGCGNLFNGKPIVEDGILEFHTNYNILNLEQIYNNAHSDFQQSTSLDEFNEFISAVHRKLGPITSTKNQGWRINTHNFVTSVILQQETQFENGNGMETFTFNIKDEEATLVGYNINSRKLIIN